MGWISALGNSFVKQAEREDGLFSSMTFFRTVKVRGQIGNLDKVSMRRRYLSSLTILRMSTCPSLVLMTATPITSADRLSEMAQITSSLSSVSSEVAVRGLAGTLAPVRWTGRGVGASSVSLSESEFESGSRVRSSMPQLAMSVSNSHMSIDASLPPAVVPPGGHLGVSGNTRGVMMEESCLVYWNGDCKALGRSG